jgi:transcription initiation factor TFIID subunit 1
MEPAADDDDDDPFNVSGLWDQGGAGLSGLANPNALRGAGGGGGPSQPAERLTMKCGKCGEMGHTRTSKQCPLYGVVDADEQTAADLGLVQRGELSFKLNVKAARAHARGADSATPILKFNLRAMDEARKRKAEDAIAYLQPKGKGTQRRKALAGPTERLNSLLNDVVKTLQHWKNLAPPFINRVKVPDYAAVIAEPICLNDMIRKSRVNEYASSTQLLADLELMRTNAHAYNQPGRGDMLVPNCADQLVQKAREDLARRAEAIREIEAELGLPLAE